MASRLPNTSNTSSINGGAGGDRGDGSGEDNDGFFVIDGRLVGSFPTFDHPAVVLNQQRRQQEEEIMLKMNDAFSWGGYSGGGGSEVGGSGGKHSGGAKSSKHAGGTKASMKKASMASSDIVGHRVSLPGNALGKSGIGESPAAVAGGGGTGGKVIDVSITEQQRAANEAAEAYQRKKLLKERYLKMLAEQQEHQKQLMMKQQQALAAPVAGEGNSGSQLRKSRLGRSVRGTSVGRGGRRRSTSGVRRGGGGDVASGEEYDADADDLLGVSGRKDEDQEQDGHNSSGAGVEQALSHALKKSGNYIPANPAALRRREVALWNSVVAMEDRRRNTSPKLNYAHHQQELATFRKDCASQLQKWKSEHPWLAPVKDDPALAAYLIEQAAEKMKQRSRSRLSPVRSPDAGAEGPGGVRGSHSSAAASPSSPARNKAVSNLSTKALGSTSPLSSSAATTPTRHDPQAQQELNRATKRAIVVGGVLMLPETAASLSNANNGSSSAGGLGGEDEEDPNRRASISKRHRSSAMMSSVGSSAAAGAAHHSPAGGGGGGRSAIPMLRSEGDDEEEDSEEEDATAGFSMHQDAASGLMDTNRRLELEFRRRLKAIKKDDRRFLTAAEFAQERQRQLREEEEQRRLRSVRPKTLTPLPYVKSVVVEIRSSSGMENSTMEHQNPNNMSRLSSGSDLKLSKSAKKGSMMMSSPSADLFSPPRSLSTLGGGAGAAGESKQILAIPLNDEVGREVTKVWLGGRR